MRLPAVLFSEAQLQEGWLFYTTLTSGVLQADMQADLMVRLTHCHLMSALHGRRQKVLEQHPDLFTV